ncbi:MAG: beta-aspartyl-peptidase [Bacillota bacterium]
MILIKNVDLYSPEKKGIKDIFIAGNKIVDIQDNITMDLENVKKIEGNNLIATPGLIDSHVHILGGGGEGGFHKRTPGIKLSNVLKAGVTTLVGCLGTDGIARSMESLVAKAKSLKHYGLSVYLYSGSYQLPPTTLTGDIMKDIMFIDEIIGAGEVAISDHRSSQPSFNELKKFVSNVRRAGILSDKCGIVNFHLGDSKKCLKPINNLVENTEIPITQFLPTHINRNPELFKEGIKFAKKGGYIDFTTSTTKKFLELGEVEAPLAIKKSLEAGVSINHLTMTSDGQGSLPEFDENGNLIGMSIGTSISLLKALKKAIIKYNISIENALKTVTLNPANILSLKKKGEIKINKDADIVLFNRDFTIKYVISNGSLMIKNSKILKKGIFE